MCGLLKCASVFHWSVKVDLEIGEGNVCVCVCVMDGAGMG